MFTLLLKLTYKQSKLKKGLKIQADQRPINVFIGLWAGWSKSVLFMTKRPLFSPTAVLIYNCKYFMTQVHGT